MLIINYCEHDCEHLSITEKQQDERGQGGHHVCLKYAKAVQHGQAHPELMRLDECRQVAISGEPI